eukprot:635721-Amorphochlora_amoeboformis.AAC.1
MYVRVCIHVALPKPLGGGGEETKELFQHLFEWANEQVKLLYASWANLKNRVFTEDLQENQKRHMNAMKKESADALDKSEAARAYFDMVADLFANALKESLDEYEKRK